MSCFKKEWNEYYTWSFTRFKAWKKKFKKIFEKVYWISFNKYVPNEKERETIYKILFNMSSIDVFWTWNISIKVNIEKIRKSLEIAKNL